MTNPEIISDDNAQEQVPDLYRLLGLTPLEADPAKIQRALLAMQKKVETAQKSDVKLAQRAAKVVALGKKNLLEAERKLAYDRAWAKAFGSAEPKVIAQPQSIMLPEPAAEAKTPELEWDLDELESYLPAEDPRSPFDLGGFLRYSSSLPESNPTADYEKLQSLLGGAATATISAPESISAAVLLPEYAEVDYKSQQEDLQEHFVAPKKSVAPLRIPPGGIAKHIRRKRSRAMWLSIGGIAGVLALAFGIAFFLLSKPPEPKTDSSQLAQATPDKNKPKLNNARPNAEVSTESVSVQGSGLPKVAGFDGQSGPKPNMREGMVPENATMQPAEHMPPPATTPDATPATAPPATAPPATAPVPVPTPDPPAADATLTDAEKSTWSKSMKEVLKTLGMQDFKAAKVQLTAAESLAKTQLQRDQLKRLTSVAKLTEEFYGFLVDAINGLGAAETFKVGSSLEVAFVEGSAQAISVKIRGKVQTFALTELQIGLAMGLVDLKMDTEHPNSLARKAAFTLVHPKTNASALNTARGQMAAAAAAGAVDADLRTVFDEDYSLKK